MVKRNRKKSKAEPIRSAFCISFSGKNPVVAPPERCEHRPLQCQREALYRNTNRVPCRGGFHIRPVCGGGGGGIWGFAAFSPAVVGASIARPQRFAARQGSPGGMNPAPTHNGGARYIPWGFTTMFSLQFVGGRRPRRPAGPRDAGKVPGTMRASSPTAATQPPQHSGATSRRAAETRVPSQLVRQSRSATSRHWLSKSIMSARISSSTCPP